MKKRRWAIVVALAVALLGVADWWWYNRVPPSRPPELVGVVQAVQPDRSGIRFLVKLAPRPTGDMYWVVALKGAHVRQRQGGPGEVAVGQSVSVWQHPGVYATQPPIVYADWVIIDAPGP